MFDQLDGPSRIIAAVLGFPMLFQTQFLNYAWGAGDDWPIMVAKRLWLLLPTLAIIFGCWLTIACFVSMLFRSDRRNFVTAIFVTWWDLGRSILAFWAGTLRFGVFLLGLAIGFIKTFVFTVLVAIMDLMLFPIRFMRELSQGYTNPGVPWIATGLLLTWTLLEAVIFTYVMTPMVQDTLSGIAGAELEGPLLQIPLFLMFTVFVMGSYAVLEAFGKAFATKDVKKIINYAIIEFVVAMVEVVFLYREFVDSLVPWFAQHAGQDFHLGIIGILSISFTAWLGIRAMTWFLFGHSGVPTLMAIIERKPIPGGQSGKGLSFFDRREGNKETVVFAYIQMTLASIKRDQDWHRKLGEDFISAMLLPPLQVVAASINFCTLMISGSHMFDLPFRSYKDLVESRALMMNTKKPLMDETRKPS